jgi:predicted membrane channel-forming protein YqfA (hemolysin III family)
MTTSFEVPKKVKSDRNRSLVNLIWISDAPEYIKDNTNILGGYRREMTIRHAICTIFKWHNETLNIWTHLVATLFFIACFITFLVSPESIPILNLNQVNHQHTCVPKWPLLVFQIGVIYNSFISALYHTVLCVSKRHYEFYRKMDFISILVVMFTMFWPFCYYVFDDRKWFIIYVSVAAFVSILCTITVTMKSFQTNTFHALRPVVFAILAIWGVVPIIHASILYWIIYPIRLSIIFSLSQLALHTIGAIFYVLQWPERRGIYIVEKNTFRLADYFSSHVVFHILISLGFLSFQEANIILYRYRNQIA